MLLLGWPDPRQLRRFSEAAEKRSVEAVWVGHRGPHDPSARCPPSADDQGDLPPALGHLDLTQPVLVADELVTLLEGVGVDGVIALDPSSSVSAAFVAQRLGIGANPPPAVATSRDREASRRRWFQTGVPHPEYRAVHLDDDADHLARLVGLPCYVMPVASAGRRHRVVATEGDAAADAVSWLAALAETEGLGDLPLMVERDVGGRLFVVWGLVDGGRLRVHHAVEWPGFGEEPYGDELWVAPARLTVAERAELERVASDAVRALGLSSGPARAELRLTGRFVRVVDVAVAPPGPIEALALDRLEGSTVADLVLGEALGEHAAPAATHGAAVGALGIVAPKAGRLADVSAVLEEAADGVSVTLASSGGEVRPLPVDECHLGWLSAVGESCTEVERRLREARCMVHLVIE